MALTTFSDLVSEAREQVRRDAVAAGLPDDDVPLRDGGLGATAYAEAVSVYLAFALSRSADRGSTICSWDNSPKMEALRSPHVWATSNTDDVGLRRRKSFFLVEWELPQECSTGLLRYAQPCRPPESE